MITNFFNSEISDARVALLVFAIPIFSFIIGWQLNGWSGYLFRNIMRRPITVAYNNVYCRNTDGTFIDNYEVADDKQASDTYDIARKVINLEKVDRFYYRFVASRNMYFAQILIWGISCLIFCNTLCDNVKTSGIFVLISIVLLLFIYPIVKRDLNTHAKYVFSKYRCNENNNNQQEEN